MTFRRMMADGGQRVHEHSLEWWQHRIDVAWSYAWNANCTFLTEVVEAPARGRGGDGFLIASFEHNSSEHGLARPHVHNLMVRRAEAHGEDAPSDAERALAASYERFGGQPGRVRCDPGGRR